jgi:hypothetical protein
MLETCLQFKISFVPKHMVLPENFRSRRTPRCAQCEIWSECLMRSDESALFCLLYGYAWAAFANREQKRKQMEAKARDVI